MRRNPKNHCNTCDTPIADNTYSVYSCDAEGCAAFVRSEGLLYIGQKGEPEFTLQGADYWKVVRYGGFLGGCAYFCPQHRSNKKLIGEALAEILKAV